jgi:pimeloyl-ACP methyl ester carboxylesterase
VTTTFLVIAAVLGLGYLYEAWARSRDAKTWTHPGKLVDVGGHRLHVNAHGEGDVVVVFEADEGCWSTHWGRLPEDMGTVTASLAYDRGGLGWSEAGPPPRDAETLARELHQLIARLAPGQPAILVGHGTGAHILRAYAHRYPFETAGLVLVDPFHDGIGDRLRREQIPPTTASPFLLSLTSLLASFGILRLIQSRSSSNASLNLPERQRATLDALELNPRVRSGATEELVAESQTLEYLRRIQESGEFPMRILASTETLSADMVPPDFPRAAYNRIWAEQSEAFLDLSIHAQRVLVEGSGHQLQLDRPEVVMQAILDVIDEVRALRERPEGETEAAHMGR